jgi:hypothetical protein
MFDFYKNKKLIYNLNDNFIDRKQAMQAAKIKLKYNEEQRDWKPRVIWLYGVSGSGKTSKAFDELPDAYVHDGGIMFNGYDAHENVIFDDIKKKTLRYYELLKLLDRYPCRVQNKGGSRQFLAKNIYITSLLHPREYVPEGDNPLSLLRRIDDIHECKPPE